MNETTKEKYQRLTRELIKKRKRGLDEVEEDRFLESLDRVWSMLTREELIALRSWDPHLE